MLNVCSCCSRTNPQNRNPESPPPSLNCLTVLDPCRVDVAVTNSCALAYEGSGLSGKTADRSHPEGAASAVCVGYGDMMSRTYTGADPTRVSNLPHIQPETTVYGQTCSQEASGTGIELSGSDADVRYMRVGTAAAGTCYRTRASTCNFKLKTRSSFARSDPPLIINTTPMPPHRLPHHGHSAPLTC